MLHGTVSGGRYNTPAAPYSNGLTHISAASANPWRRAQKKQRVRVAAAAGSTNGPPAPPPAAQRSAAAPARQHHHIAAAGPSEGLVAVVAEPVPIAAHPPSISMSGAAVALAAGAAIAGLGRFFTADADLSLLFK